MVDWCGVMWWNMVWCCGIMFGVVRFGRIWCGVGYWGEMLWDVVWCYVEWWCHVLWWCVVDFHLRRPVVLCGMPDVCGEGMGGRDDTGKACEKDKRIKMIKESPRAGQRTIPYRSAIWSSGIMESWILVTKKWYPSHHEAAMSWDRIHNPLIARRAPYRQIYSANQ